MKKNELRNILKNAGLFEDEEHDSWNAAAWHDDMGQNLAHNEFLFKNGPRDHNTAVELVSTTIDTPEGKLQCYTDDTDIVCNDNTQAEWIQDGPGGYICGIEFRSDGDREIQKAIYKLLKPIIQPKR